MQWCKEAGLAHSEFLEWDVDDRAKALAYLIEENAKCSMCGTAEWEWDPAQGGSRRAYEPIEMFCMGCYLKHIADEGNDKMAGTTVSLIPTSTQEYARNITAKKKAADERAIVLRERKRSSKR